MKIYNETKEDKELELYNELIELAFQLNKFYIVDKVKYWAVFVCSKCSNINESEDLFDILSDRIIVYNKEHNIIDEVKPIIECIQNKLKEIENVYK